MAKLVPGPPPAGNIVKEFYLGSTHVTFCDDAYSNRSKDEQLQSIEKVGVIASKDLGNQPPKPIEKQRANK